MDAIADVIASGLQEIFARLDRGGPDAGGGEAMAASGEMGGPGRRAAAAPDLPVNEE